MDLGFDISNLTSGLNASANIYNGIVGWYVLGVRDAKVYQIDKIDIRVPENKELLALFEKYELAEPTEEGQTHAVGPVCLKESDEEIYRYFQNLLVDDYPIDYQIEASREFAEYSSFTTDDEVELRDLKFEVEKSKQYKPIENLGSFALKILGTPNELPQKHRMIYLKNTE